MKTAFEEGGDAEQQPLPGEVIQAFESNHRALVHSALKLYASPSTEALANFINRADVATSSVGLFFMQNFFKEAETPIPLYLSVAAVTSATEEIAEKTRIINPSWVALAEYSDEDREKIIENLTEDDEDVSGQAVQNLCKNYGAMVGNMKEGVFQSPNVSRFLKNRARKEQLQGRAISVGVAAVGTFLGVWLAERRKK